MTDTDRTLMATTTTVPGAFARRSLTDQQLGAEASEAFGEDPLDWAFQCPSCGDIATGREFPPGKRSRLGAECIGLHVPGRGCQRVAGAAFIPGPWLVQLEDGTIAASFPLAPAPSRAPQSTSQIPSDTPGGAGPEKPSVPLSTPVRALFVERQAPGARRTLGGGGVMLDPENWDYRVALGEQQSVLGYRDARPDVPVTVLFVDTATGPYDWCHNLAPDMDAAKEHIEQHRLPITDGDLIHAVLLIVEACAEDTAAAGAEQPQVPPAEPRPFVHDA